MPADGPRCANCKHYLANDDKRADPPLIVGNDEGYGSCRRYPPQADPIHRLAESIDNLRYFPNRDDPGDSPTINEAADERLQPIIIQLERTDSAVAVWPRVHETEWCGEFSDA